MVEKNQSSVAEVLRDYIGDRKLGQEHEKKARKRTSSPGPKERVRSVRSGLRRERTEDLLRRHEIERQERQYRNWEYVKEEARDEKYDMLSRKVALQKELIRANDALHRQQRQQEDEDHVKKREETRQARQAQEEALMRVCRQSLEEDKKQYLQLRAENRKNKASASSALITTGNDSQSQTDVDHCPSVPPEGYGLRLRRVSSFRKPHLAGGGGEVSSAVCEEQEDGEGSGEEDEETLAWHEMQLVQLYGRKDAEHFLRPKLLPKVVRPLNPQLRKQGGRAGASALWCTLREDSRKRLLREDASIPGELKLAYSSFVRQLLSKKRKPVKRNYFCKEDVPEMSRLLDQSTIINVQDLRHKHELMYRSSRNNQDRTHVLVYNNPLPNFNNWSGEESVERYLPSWLDEDSISSEDSFKKWLAWRQLAPPNPPIDEETEQDENDSVANQIADEWAFLKAHRKQNKEKKQLILFLTEAEARCAGQFSRRRREQLENRHLPQGYEREAVKAQSALERIDSGLASERGSLNSGMSSESAPAAAQRNEDTSQLYTSQWQPLSMNALVEYKKQKQTNGDGKFRHGQHRMFAVKS